MEKALIATLLALLTALAGIGYKISALEQVDLSKEMDKYQAWVQWQQQYGKVYSNEEMPLKYATFSANYDFVQNFNS